MGATYKKKLLRESDIPVDVFGRIFFFKENTGALLLEDVRDMPAF